MTATRDRRSDLDPDADADLGEPAWDERPVIGNTRGLPWWGAVLLAFGMAAVAAYIDMERQGSLGRIYQGAYVLGCIAAVCWVRRRNLFGPMVQPPLVFAVTAIGAVLWFSPSPLGGSSWKQLVFSVALPLTSNFPTMAITTGATVVVGLLRLWLQRDPNPRMRSNRSVRDRDPLDDRGPRAADRAPRTGRRPMDRSRPDRAAGATDDRDRAGRSRRDQDRQQGLGNRQRGGRNAGRMERPSRDVGADGRDNPPRSGRGRAEPPATADRARRTDRGRSGGQPEPTPRRQPGLRRTQRRDDRPAPDRRDGQGAAEPPRRQPRRPPDETYR